MLYDTILYYMTFHHITLYHIVLYVILLYYINHQQISFFSARRLHFFSVPVSLGDARCGGVSPWILIPRILVHCTLSKKATGGVCFSDAGLVPSEVVHSLDEVITGVLKKKSLPRMVPCRVMTCWFLVFTPCFARQQLTWFATREDWRC